MKKGIITLLCAGMIVLSGCYGKNACFNKLHDWNGTLGNKWINSIVHFFLNVFPVYMICLGLVDGLVLNTIEFWTGSNPLAADDSYYQKDEQGNSVAAVKNEDGTLSVQYTTVKGETTSLTLQRDENVVRALDAEGNLVAQYEIEK
jgi:outer membrane protein assembly factor BamB